jgi:hypothetical protein
MPSRDSQCSDIFHSAIARSNAIRAPVQSDRCTISHIPYLVAIYSTVAESMVQWQAITILYISTSLVRIYSTMAESMVQCEAPTISHIAEEAR